MFRLTSIACLVAVLFALPLADLGNSFRVVREMRIFLVGKREVLLVLLASAGPALPLLFTKFPVFDLLERLVLTMVR